MGQWLLIERDLHDVYGIDAGDQALMGSRSWRWLRVRILGLFDATPLYVPLADGSVRTVPGTRLGRHFQQD